LNTENGIWWVCFGIMIMLQRLELYLYKLSSCEAVSACGLLERILEKAIKLAQLLIILYRLKTSGRVTTKIYISFSVWILIGFKNYSNVVYRWAYVNHCEWISRKLLYRISILIILNVLNGLFDNLLRNMKSYSNFIR